EGAFPAAYFATHAVPTCPEARGESVHSPTDQHHSKVGGPPRLEQLCLTGLETANSLRLRNEEK
ncbi:hypothetical protein Tco_0579979, partial [Tanacetum coccineum]